MTYYELYHYGITGMKHGIRRYQNADGSLTAAGRERYGKMISKASYRESRRNARAGKSVITEKDQKKILDNFDSFLKKKYSEDMSATPGVRYKKFLNSKWGQRNTQMLAGIAGNAIHTMILASKFRSGSLSAEDYAYNSSMDKALVRAIVKSYNDEKNYR